jgi:hypothetical protein
MTPDPAAALDRLAREAPPVDDDEYRRWKRAFALLYPVEPWRRWSRRESERRRARRQQEPNR